MNRSRIGPPRSRRVRIFAAALVLAVSTGGCKSAVQSVWRTHEVKIDGQNEEWDGAMHIFPDQQVDVGLMNDNRWVYLAVFAGDRERQSQILSSGCTIWWNVGGEKEETFGVRYPHGLPPERRHEFVRAWSKGPEAAVAETHALDGEPELVGKDGPLMATAADDSIETALKPYRDALIYEMRMPLVRIGPNGVGPGQDIEIGIEISGVKKHFRHTAEKDKLGSGDEGRGSSSSEPPSAWIDSPQATSKGPTRSLFWLDVKLAQPS
jgi:hypothetical protein